jgi:hypothetical protein
MSVTLKLIRTVCIVSFACNASVVPAEQSSSKSEAKSSIQALAADVIASGKQTLALTETALQTLPSDDVQLATTRESLRDAYRRYLSQWASLSRAGENGLAAFADSSDSLREFESLMIEPRAIDKQISAAMEQLRAKGFVLTPPQAADFDPAAAAQKARRELNGSIDCPISVESINTHVASKQYQHIYVPAIDVRWKNTTGKTISGLKLGLRYFDATGDTHDHSGNLMTDQKAKPLEVKRSEWTLYDADNYTHFRMEVWPVKVLFEDGSSWLGDGSDSCKFDSSANKGSWWKR